jgi:hypothetical protein
MNILVYIVLGFLLFIFPFWYFVPREIWQPWTSLSECPKPLASALLQNAVAQGCQIVVGAINRIGKNISKWAQKLRRGIYVIVPKWQ